MTNDTNYSNSSKSLLVIDKDNNKPILSKMDLNVIDPKVLTLINDESHISNNSIYSKKYVTISKNETRPNTTSSIEWKNSVYFYNKNYIKNLPIARNVVHKLLTSYFNFTNFIKGKKANTKVILFKKQSLNRVFVSKADVKMTSDKVNLTVYIYNRTKLTLLKRLKRVIRNKKFRGFYNEKITCEKGLALDDKKLIETKKPQTRLNKKRNKIIKKFTKKGIYFIRDVRKLKNKLIRSVHTNLKPNNINNSAHLLSPKVKTLISKNFSKYEFKYFARYLKALYLRELITIRYIKRTLTANNRFKNWFLLGLKKILTRLYNKRVELNIVNQKYFYLNSDIFTKALLIRIRNRKNRILRELKKGFAKVSLPKTNLKNIKQTYKNTNCIERLSLINSNLKTNIFNNIKYKHVKGIRIEAAGRLTKRLTASRSKYYLKYRGNLKNNTYDDRLDLYVRGYAKPNLQYTFLNAKTRNGAFGLKGWVSSN